MIYGWDAANRLISQVMPPLQSGSGARVLSYLYRYDDLLHQKVGPRGTETLTWDGADPIFWQRSQDGLFQLVVHGNSAIRSVGTGSGGGGALANHLHLDAQANVQATTDAAQAISQDVAWDLFGDVTLGQSRSNPLDYGGGMGYWNDYDTPLTYVRARWLDPNTGRWLSRDPVETEHPYAYAGNSPMLYADPSGMQSLAPDDPRKPRRPSSPIRPEYGDPRGFYNRLIKGKDIVQSPIPYASGFAFIVVEQLPKIGTRYVIRKVIVVPFDYARAEQHGISLRKWQSGRPDVFGMRASDPMSNMTIAQHALDDVKGADSKLSPFLSTSSFPFGAPNMIRNRIGLNDSRGRLTQGAFIIDTDIARRSGARIYTVADVVADLQRHAKEYPQSRQNVEALIRFVKTIEGETLIAPTSAGIPPNASKPVSDLHLHYIQRAEDIYNEHVDYFRRPENFVNGEFNPQVLDPQLTALAREYELTRLTGRAFRVVGVAGIIFTSIDLAVAMHNSLSLNDFRPIQIAAARTVGGLAGGILGAEHGAVLGGLLGMETGPGAIISAGIGGLIFGILGAMGAERIVSGPSDAERTRTQLDDQPHNAIIRARRPSDG